MTQCDQCRHDGTRGGVVFEATRVCELACDQGRLGSIVEKLCQQQAASGRCPCFEEVVAPPDSYRSEDLPRHALLEHHT